jgi:hypothetical protein
MRIPAFRVRTLMIAVAIAAGLSGYASLTLRLKSRMLMAETHEIQAMSLSMEAQTLDAILHGDPVPQFVSCRGPYVPPKPVKQDLGPEEREKLFKRLRECRVEIEYEGRLIRLYEYGCRYPWRSLPSDVTMQGSPKPQ